jgi:L-amino acid N-acyltransferase YncA
MITVRDARTADSVAMCAIYNDAVAHTTAVFDDVPRTLEAQQAWLSAKGDQGWPVLVAETAGRVVGYASFGAFRAWPAYRHTVENSVYVAPDVRGQGVGTQLLGPLLDSARQRRLHAVIAAITADNQASLRLHARFGYREVGRFPEVGHKFERWLDVVFLQLLL